MDIAYLFCHSKFDDVEFRCSLRSVAQHAGWVRKVWVFGDRPEFLSGDRGLIEHVAWEAVAWIGRFRTPVRNFFLQCFLIAQQPEVASEFLVFCDDYILLDHLTEAVARRSRFLQDLGEVTNRGSGLWKESLWRTYDWLKRFGYGGLNFETHTPMFLTKKRVFEAYRDLQDFVTEDRFGGMLGPTAILNHAYKQQPFPLTLQSDEGLSVGFHHKPATYDEIVEKARGKLFLNFDDDAFSDDLRRFLAERFPEPCQYERAEPSVRSGVFVGATKASDVAATHGGTTGDALPVGARLNDGRGVAVIHVDAARQPAAGGVAKDVAQVFEGIYQTRAWGPTAPVSGRGATLEQTRRLVRELPGLLAEYEIRSLLDLPCGDWNWMKLVDLAGIDYLGADIVHELIAKNRAHDRPGVRFEWMNLLTSPLPRVDAILIRDCLVHLTYEQILTALRNVVQSGSCWLLTTTFPGRAENRDIPAGRWRPLNLELPPFRLPTPERYFVEACTEGNGRFADKSLGLWRIESLAAT